MHHCSPQLQTVCATPTHQESMPTGAIVAQLEKVRTLCYWIWAWTPGKKMHTWCYKFCSINVVRRTWVQQWYTQLLFKNMFSINFLSIYHNGTVALVEWFHLSFGNICVLVSFIENNAFWHMYKFRDLFHHQAVSFSITSYISPFFPLCWNI